MAKRGLGRGIDSLIQVTRDEPAQWSNNSDESNQASESPQNEHTPVLGSTVATLSIDRIIANPDQPRKEFNQEHLQELSDSIKQSGVIQPILVEPSDESYIIIAGERRYRGAKMAGLSEIPAIIRRFSEEEKYEIALIENIQREDLTAIEEARAYKNLIDRFELSQDELAQKLGKNRSTIANSLRLLKLPENIQDALGQGSLSAGHARALLSVTQGGEAQFQMFRTIMDHGLSVRDAEALSKLINEGTNPSHALSSLRDGGNSGRSGNEVGEGAPEPDIDIMALTRGANITAHESKPESSDDRRRRSPELWGIEEDLIRALGTKVQIKGDEKRGKIEIAYYSLEDLERVFDLLKGRN